MDQMIFRLQPVVMRPVHPSGKVKGLCLEDKVWIAAVLIVFLKNRAKSTSGTDLVAAVPGVPYIDLLITHHVPPPYADYTGRRSSRSLKLIGSAGIITFELSYLIGQQIF